jgi:glucokinase
VPERTAAVGIDVGGTKIAAGLVAADGGVVHAVRRDTPTEPEAIDGLIAELAADLRRTAGRDDLPVGVGVAGLLDLDGVMRFAPNLPYRDHPVRARVSALLGSPVVVENDANAAAWGEYRAGAGAAARSSLVMITLGTGVGGGLVLGDAMVRGGHGMGAEFGHIIVDEGGPLCRCGNHGDLESWSSGSALGRMAREAVAAGEVPAGSPLLDGTPTGRSVTDAAHGGDAVALGILARAGFWLGVGIASLVNALDPEVVVVGGGAMHAGDLILAPARAAAAARIAGRDHRAEVPVIPARLADAAGVIGAGLLALERDGEERY